MFFLSTYHLVLQAVHTFLLAFIDFSLDVVTLQITTHATATPEKKYIIPLDDRRKTLLVHVISLTTNVSVRLDKAQSRTSC